MDKNDAHRFAVLVTFILLPYLLLISGGFLNPLAVDTGNVYASPSPSSPFGSDGLGRDLLARTLYAAGFTLHAVLLAVSIALVLGLLLGTIAGYYYGRWPDVLISWVISLVFSVPFILWVVGFLIVIGGGLSKAFIVIGCLWWVGPARLVRSEVMRLRSSTAVMADRALGFTETKIFSRNILPQAFSPAVLSLVYYLPELISLEVGLSFFGLGAQPPAPSLGRLIFEGVNRFYTGWWLSLFPAATLLVIVIAVYGITHYLYLDRKPQNVNANA